MLNVMLANYAPIYRITSAAQNKVNAAITAPYVDKLFCRLTHIKLILPSIYVWLICLKHAVADDDVTAAAAAAV